MPPGPASPDPGLPISGESPLTEEEWDAWSAAVFDEEELPGLEDEDPDDPALPGGVGLDAIEALDAIETECRRIDADQARTASAAARLGTTGALAAAGATLGHRGPGQSGSAAETRWAADHMLSLAWDLEVKLPGTKAAFRTGVLSQVKAASIARATAGPGPR